MILESMLAQALVGVGGGLAAELLHWYMLARKPEGIEAYRKKGLYWFTTLCMVLLGGSMPVLYVNGEASALLCFHLGAATPILLQKLINAPPDASAGMGLSARSGLASFRDFFRW
ncbi:MAG TPA: hypothetical protein VF017_23740 [Thermoanaerobaculia bacterium]|nr:hypothetical protein [Thermoanaerobaculia bacterium]